MQRRTVGTPSGRLRGARAYLAIALVLAATAAVAGLLANTVASAGTPWASIGARLLPASSDAGILAMLGIGLTLVGVLIGRGGNRD